MKPWVHIVGGGLSGLSLARALAKYSNLPGPVVISEPQSKITNDKTFSFWFDEFQRTLLVPEVEYKHWSLSTSSEHIEHIGESMRYGSRSALSVYTEAHASIQRHPQITLNQAALTHPPEAEHVFDSRPPKIDDFRITQSFAGTEVQFSQPHGISKVSLMNDLHAIAHGVEFVYVLPLSPSRLLVEHTQFTTKIGDLAQLQKLNEDWLKQSFNQPFQITRVEKAHIPMGFESTSEHWGMPIGTRAGMTRDSTGYGYSTIKQWCNSSAHSLVKHNQCQSYQPSSLYRWMDSLLLDLIQHRPDVIPSIFMSMARGCDSDTFASFMMKTQTRDAMKVILHAPTKPFICVLLKQYQWI
jgi:lycopene beta-cyclase